MGIKGIDDIQLLQEAMESGQQTEEAMSETAIQGVNSELETSTGVRIVLKRR